MSNQEYQSINEVQHAFLNEKDIKVKFQLNQDLANGKYDHLPKSIDIVEAEQPAVVEQQVVNTPVAPVTTEAMPDDLMLRRELHDTINNIKKDTAESLASATQGFESREGDLLRKIDELKAINIRNNEDDVFTIDDDLNALEAEATIGNSDSPELLSKIEQMEAMLIKQESRISELSQSGQERELANEKAEALNEYRDFFATDEGRQYKPEGVEIGDAVEGFNKFMWDLEDKLGSEDQAMRLMYDLAKYPNVGEKALEEAGLAKPQGFESLFSLFQLELHQKGEGINSTTGARETIHKNTYGDLSEAHRQMYGQKTEADIKREAIASVQNKLAEHANAAHVVNPSSYEQHPSGAEKVTGVEWNSFLRHVRSQEKSFDSTPGSIKNLALRQEFIERLNILKGNR